MTERVDVVDVRSPLSLAEVGVEDNFEVPVKPVRRRRDDGEEGFTRVAGFRALAEQDEDMVKADQDKD